MLITFVLIAYEEDSNLSKSLDTGANPVCITQWASNPVTPTKQQSERTGALKIAGIQLQRRDNQLHPGKS